MSSISRRILYTKSCWLQNISHKILSFLKRIGICVYIYIIWWFQLKLWQQRQMVISLCNTSSNTIATSHLEHPPISQYLSNNGHSFCLSPVLSVSSIFIVSSFTVLRLESLMYITLLAAVQIVILITKVI